MKHKLLIISLVFIGQSFGQTLVPLASYGQSIDFKYKLGFLIAHREAMAHLPQSHFQTFELSYDFHSRGYQGWEQVHNNPKFGVLATATINSNKVVLGDAFGLAGTLTLPKLRWSKSNTWALNNKIALGLGYLTRRFDLEENPKNVAIGTHLNLLIVLGTEIRFSQPDYFCTFGLDFTHFSNGGTKKPNLGLNIPSLRIGFGWMTKRGDLYNESVKDFERNDLELLLTANFSAKNNYEFQNSIFPVFGLSAYFTKKQGSKYRYLYGVDLSHNEANRQFLSSLPDQSVIETIQLGMYNSWELDLSRFVFSVGMGAYLYNPQNPFGWFYHRIGGRFYMTDTFYVHGYVRSHWARADYFETGLGYRFVIRK
jgi:hypothetical protein